jgi:putative phosphoesterase
MKIAVLSDIHANKYALSAVLRGARKEGVAKILVLGDLVGYYYHPLECWQMLSEWDTSFVRGNHEIMLKSLLDGRCPAEELKKKYGSGVDIARNTLPQDVIERLINAPDRMEVELATLRILMCHGAPWDPDTYLYPDTVAEILQKCGEPGFDFVCVGHSHYSFAVRTAHGMLINAGSVGQSRVTGGIASWCSINSSSKTFQLKSTPYDTSQLIDEVKQTDPANNYLHEVLLRHDGIR